MIIATITPNNYFMPMQSVESFIELFKNWQIDGGLEFINPSGSTLYHNRNRAFDYAKNKGDSLFFIDSDIVFDASQVFRIFNNANNHDIKMFTGVYNLFDREQPAIFKRKDNDYEYYRPNEIERIDACGMGFVYISKEIIQTLPKEPFNPITELGIQHGEDISFCKRVTDAGFEIWVDHNLKVGQVRTHIA